MLAGEDSFRWAAQEIATDRMLHAQRNYESAIRRREDFVNRNPDSSVPNSIDYYKVIAARNDLIAARAEFFKYFGPAIALNPDVETIQGVIASMANEIANLKSRISSMNENTARDLALASMSICNAANSLRSL